MLLNICLVSYEFPPMIGGEGKYTFTLAVALSALGHDVTVITTDISGDIEDQKKYEFEIIRLPIRKTGLKLFFFDKLAKKKIREICDYRGIDIIHFTNDFMFLSISKKDINVPIVSTIHHPWGAERKFYKTKTDYIGYLKYVYAKKIYYLEWLEKKMCKKSDKLIAVSRYTANYIINEHQIPTSKVTVIPNSVDIEIFHPEINGKEIRERLNLLFSPLVLYVGKLDYHKGIDTLIESFSRVICDIPDAKLLIVGGGPIKKNIENLIDNFGLKESVILVGRVSEEDLPKYYAASNLVVLPSLMEGFGIVLLEAMASGKPCIATNVGGTEDVVVDNETGFIIPPAYPDSLYKAILTLLLDDNLSIEFGNRGRQRVLENFTKENIAEKTLNVYDQVFQPQTIFFLCFLVFIFNALELFNNI